MTEKRRKSIVYCVLVVAVIWGIWNDPFTAKKNRPGSFETKTANETHVVVAEIAAPAITDGDSTGELGWTDDPFVRPNALKHRAETVTEKPAHFKLSAISTSGGGTMAIINGEIVKQGGAIHEWTVADINDNSVLLKKGTESRKLTLRR